MDKIFKEELHWYPKPNTKSEYYNEQYPMDFCFLRLNDFPEEIMWTLFNGNKEYNFDETPSNWTFTYRSKNEDNNTSENKLIVDIIEQRVHWIKSNYNSHIYFSEYWSVDECYMEIASSSDDYMISLYFLGEVTKLKEVPENWSIEW